MRVAALTNRNLPPAAQRVLAVIRGTDGQPMIAGGYVRDTLLGAPGKDIDIEVWGVPDFERLAYALAEAGFTVNAVGVSYGVLLVRADGLDFDVSLPRRDSKTGTGHRGFTVVPDATLGYTQACARRDLTINAMLADPDTGEVIDCHGGQDDLRAGILRHTSAAFTEDPLRVLRAVQFAARFGFRLAPETAALCRTITGTCTELAAERVWGEVEKIGTRGVHITAALQVLRETGWERHFPQIAALHGIRQDPRHHPEGDVWTHAGLAADQAARLADAAGLAGEDRFVAVMAALCHDFGKVTHTQRDSAAWRAVRMVLRGRRWRITSRGHAEAGVEPARVFLRGVGCPDRITARILPLIREHMNCAATPTKPAVRRLARRLVPATMTELALVVAADHAGRGNPDAAGPAGAWLEAARDVHVQERPAKGILTGHHLIAAGMTPGPAFKLLLAQALAAQDAGQFSDEIGAVHWLDRVLDLAEVPGRARS